ncbi:hypothetical protein CTI12_AA154590 [Artemisia annua]|uniref:Helitron helicase-like domain-containing protein n=1 Tax=Artemisia annua TaxID=35608 RepID=A0A2U1PGV7_ARTAN|nr:hypothetical protein CTI12_AA154590 [Artemisia annua]
MGQSKKVRTSSSQKFTQTNDPTTYGCPAYQMHNIVTANISACEPHVCHYSVASTGHECVGCPPDESSAVGYDHYPTDNALLLHPKSSSYMSKEAFTLNGRCLDQPTKTSATCSRMSTKQPRKELDAQQPSCSGQAKKKNKRTKEVANKAADMCDASHHMHSLGQPMFQTVIHGGEYSNTNVTVNAANAPDSLDSMQGIVKQLPLYASEVMPPTHGHIVTNVAPAHSHKAKIRKRKLPENQASKRCTRQVGSPTHVHAIGQPSNSAVIETNVHDNVSATAILTNVAADAWHDPKIRKKRVSEDQRSKRCMRRVHSVNGVGGIGQPSTSNQQQMFTQMGANCYAKCCSSTAIYKKKQAWRAAKQKMILQTPSVKPHLLLQHKVTTIAVSTRNCFFYLFSLVGGDLLLHLLITYTFFMDLGASTAYDDLGDCTERCQYCDATFWHGSNGPDLDEEVVQGLIHFLDAHNELVQIFRTARDKCAEHDVPEFKVRLYSGEGPRGYELPTSQTLGAIVFDSGPESESNYDVILEYRDGVLKRISKIHKSYMSLQFPLIFIYGQPGYHTKLMLRTADPNDEPRPVPLLPSSAQPASEEKPDQKIGSKTPATPIPFIDQASLQKKKDQQSGSKAAKRALFQHEPTDAKKLQETTPTLLPLADQSISEDKKDVQGLSKTLPPSPPLTDRTTSDQKKMKRLAQTPPTKQCLTMKQQKQRSEKHYLHLYASSFVCHCITECKKQLLLSSYGT